jgi:hypothetical protein
MTVWIDSLPEVPAAATSEKRLGDLASQELRKSPYRELRKVDCTARGNVVIITGRVRSFYYKQLAQSHLQGKLSAAVSLDNRLEVSE